MSEAAASEWSKGFLNSLGLRLTHSEDGMVRGELLLGSDHLNRSGSVHGGVVCTMIDFAACASGLHRAAGDPERFGITLSLNTQFTHPARSGLIMVEGRLMSAGRRIYTAEARVRDSGGQLLAHGSGTFQWRSGSEPGAGHAK